MKFLTDRQEIAKLINIKKVPVLRINIGKPIDSILKDCYKGDKVRVNDNKGYDCRCEIAMFGDENGNENHEKPYLYKRIGLKQGAIGISSAFGYSDVMEMAEWNRCPVVGKGDEVIVVFYDDDKKICFVRHMKVENHIDSFCSTVALLEDIDKEN